MTLCGIVLKALKEFCSNTSLHGYKYIVSKNKSNCERFFWFVLVLSLHIAALVVSLIAYNSYKEYPTITVTDSTHNSIWNYPFPAVTLCSINKISKEKAYNLAHNLNKPFNLSDEELAKQFHFLVQLINPNDNKYTEKNLSGLQEIFDENGLEAYEALRKLSPGCKKLQRCLWKSEEKRCESLVEEIATTDGYCCAFNYFGIKNHTFSKGVDASKAASKPRRVSACGFNTALEVLVQNTENDYFALDIPAHGHKLYVHHPYEFPDWSIPLLFLPNRFVMFVSVSPSITYSTKQVQSLKIKMRNCLHYKERELILFQYYTYHNCMSECRMNLTKLYCSCIPFYYKNDNAVFLGKERICNLKDVPCLKKIKDVILNSSAGFDMSRINNHDVLIDKSLCKCLPTCEFATYPYEASSGSIINNLVNSNIDLYVGLNITNQSVYRVFFSDLTATRNRCDLSYNWDVLLALFGGILGLFIGFSFVAAFELIYYFTIRPLITFILQLKNRQTKQVKINFHPSTN